MTAVAMARRRRRANGSGAPRTFMVRVGVYSQPDRGRCGGGVEWVYHGGVMMAITVEI